jgi:hypothetical protein
VVEFGHFFLEKIFAKSGLLAIQLAIQSLKLTSPFLPKKWSDRLFDPKQGDQIGGELF